MKLYDEKHIKNIVLLGSPKSGKTTLAETMLYEAGIINRRGSIEKGTTVSDYHDIEKERKNSIFSTVLHTEWRNYKINIIDTPGLDDFMGEVIAPVRVADTVLFVVNAQYGVEVGTDLQWEYVDRFAKPTLFAINQLDHPKADYEMSVETLKSHFGPAVTVMQYPVQSGENFNEIIDLLKMVMYRFPAEGGKPEKLPIPQNEKDKADRLHNELVEKAAENDEDLMELYFDKGNLSEDEMRAGLRIGMRNHDVFPVFCISAEKNMGSGRLMGFIDNVAPAPVDTKPERDEEDQEIKYDPEGEPLIFIFKTLYEPNMGKMSFFKVISGKITSGMELVNSVTGQTERISQLFMVDGHERHQVEELSTGDIGAVLKLKETLTNHSLSEKGDERKLKPIVFPEARIRVSVEADSKSDEDKMSEALHKLAEEDQTLKFSFSAELKQLILSCQGELHMNVIKKILADRYNINVHFGEPKVPYRETIQKSAEAAYKHKKQSGGAGQFAEVYIKIEPWYENMPDPEGFNVRGTEEISLDWGGKLVFCNCIVGGTIDARFIPSVLKGIMEKMEIGPLTGSYVRDVRVILYDGKMHSVDSNDVSFKIAGAQAFSDAFRKAAPQLLEPVNNLEVRVPEELMGEVMTDLQTRRSMIMGVDTKGQYQVIKAKTPLSELNRYTTVLRSLTQGRGNFTTRFDSYAAVPNELQNELISAHKDVELVE